MTDADDRYFDDELEALERAVEEYHTTHPEARPDPNPGATGECVCWTGNPQDYDGYQRACPIHGYDPPPPPPPADGAEKALDGEMIGLSLSVALSPDDVHRLHEWSRELQRAGFQRGVEQGLKDADEIQREAQEVGYQRGIDAERRESSTEVARLREVLRKSS